MVEVGVNVCKYLPWSVWDTEKTMSTDLGCTGPLSCRVALITGSIPGWWTVPGAAEVELAVARAAVQ